MPCTLRLLALITGVTANFSDGTEKGPRNITGDADTDGGSRRLLRRRQRLSVVCRCCVAPDYGGRANMHRCWSRQLKSARPHRRQGFVTRIHTCSCVVTGGDTPQTSCCPALISLSSIPHAGVTAESTVDSRLRCGMRAYALCYRCSS
jgi:hypothetical protein